MFKTKVIKIQFVNKQSPYLERIYKQDVELRKITRKNAVRKEERKKRIANRWRLMSGIRILVRKMMGIVWGKVPEITQVLPLEIETELCKYIYCYYISYLRVMLGSFRIILKNSYVSIFVNK